MPPVDLKIPLMRQKDVNTFLWLIKSSKKIQRKKFSVTNVNVKTRREKKTNLLLHRAHPIWHVFLMLIINGCNAIRISIVFTYFDDGTTDRFRITFCHLYILSVHNVAVILKHNQIYLFRSLFSPLFLHREKKSFIYFLPEMEICISRSTVLEFVECLWLWFWLEIDISTQAL